MPADQPSVALPVARVVVDMPLAHLDRPFDYAVTPTQDAAAVPGARVRVRFAGTLRDGFILERLGSSEHEGELSNLHKVVSSEGVLTPEIAALIRSVADHYAGTFADVVRLAVPPRHAATEAAAAAVATVATVARPSDEPPPAAPTEPLSVYPTGSAYLAALRAGRSPRAAWQVTPGATDRGDWAAGLAAAARAAGESGRGSILIAPDQRDLDRLTEACEQALGPTGFAVLVAEAGPAARYRAFLAALRGQVKVVIGNRAAAYAPVSALGLVGLWDDGDDLLSDPRAPYPHARDVLALRAAQSAAGVLFAAYGRTAEIQRWVERGWLTELADDRPTVRHTAPHVRVAADTDSALARDPAARTARLPHDVFELLRGAVPQGPVLVQVPRAGYLVALVCGDCREPVRCQECEGPVRSGPGPAAASAGSVQECRWCGRLQVDWDCRICGSRRTRAPLVGAERTAEELGKAFPQTPVLRSERGHILARVDARPMLVVATPGAEPPAEGGYAAAVLLDTQLLLLRDDLRAGEEAFRRWSNAAALVRSGVDGGTVLAVGDSPGRALQALVRVDPAGFAARELADRRDAGFPPAVKLITVEGSANALAEVIDLLDPPDDAHLLGPVEVRSGGGDQGGEPLQRLILRAPVAQSAALVKAVRDVLGVRSARKSDGALRVRVDPVVIT